MLLVLPIAAAGAFFCVDMFNRNVSRLVVVVAAEGAIFRADMVKHELHVSCWFVNFISVCCLWQVSVHISKVNGFDVTNPAADYVSDIMEPLSHSRLLAPGLAPVFNRSHNMYLHGQQRGKLGLEQLLTLGFPRDVKRQGQRPCSRSASAFQSFISLDKHIWYQRATPIQLWYNDDSLIIQSWIIGHSLTAHW